MSTSNELLIINAATKGKLIRITQSGVFKIDDKILVGDLYRDPENLQVAIVIVHRALPVEDLDKALENPPAL